MTTNNGFQKMRDGSGAGVMDTSKYEGILDGLRKEFRQGKTKKEAWRRQQLTQLVKMVEENHEKITAAVRKDHGGPKIRGLGEMGSHAAAEFALGNLSSWMADEKVTTPFQVSPTFIGRSHIRKEPKGVVLLIAPWNYPIELVLTPLVSIIAAGNCAVIKPSEVSTNSSEVLEELINKYLDTSCIKVIQGAVPETTALLKLQWDHIFYTGNGHVGRIVSRAAAEHLTPVTLELGGKSPVIIDKTAKMASVISRVSSGKWFNVGQTCIAPDYILVHKDIQEEFLKGMEEALKGYGADPKSSVDWGNVISSRHVERISSLVKDTKGKVRTGGLETVDTEAKYMPPTIISGPSLDEPLMKEEIFGPVLPVIALDSMSDAVGIVNKVCDKPLALYVFSEDQKFVKSILDQTQSGGVAINTCVEHFMNIHLPFGGIGPSGYGACHGKHGFDDFTHHRSCLKQDTLIKKDASLPPAPVPEKMYDILIKVTTTGFIPRKYRGMTKHLLRGLLLALLLWAVKKMVSHAP
eukprot:TRINITY_DN26827_c0_g1_i1.p1 TRINITY_DN26827_c0_g1~~TRINITY_DN26827_c0_g1_i1.p1  ORF type:complete len:537 (+),score=166.92 TRINITY_DN26827_c0_g1_i1:51-1613(+)